MSFWLSSAHIVTKLDRLRAAEKRLLAFAPRFGSEKYRYQINVMDTPIPRSVVPLVSHEHDQVDPKGQQDPDHYIIHGIRVKSSLRDSEKEKEDDAKKASAPLVLLHGYMNGAAYFYRNLVGLSHAFSSVYSLDMLGWGLSSRPKYKLQLTGNDKSQREEESIQKAEEFFVESLESWRKAQGIPTMVLAGHSMGGYVSVAYAERYPQHVEKLVLLSPAGVPADNSSSEERIKRARQQSYIFRFMSATWYYLFEWNHTVGGLLRSMPESRAQKISSGYIERRLPAITDPDEQAALSEYLLVNNILPGSGEHMLRSFLTHSVSGRKPTELRVPNLRVPSVSFLYGARDWMDVDGGLCAQVRSEISPETSPNVSVYRVRDAGHLLMLDNYKEVNEGVMQAASLSSPSTHNTPEHVKPTPDHYRTVAATMETQKEELLATQVSAVEVAAS